MADTTKLGKIFIGGLSYETTDEKLRSYFGAYGTVTDAVVMKDPISRRSRGFGFITYADPVCVDRALAQPNHILDSRRVEAKRAVPRAESMRDIGNCSSSSRGNGSNSISSISVNSTVGATKKIFVGGLHYETKDADFKKYFMQYGKVVSAEVMFNRETNKSRGFGFVIFESEASVELVLQDKNHVIDGKSVEVKRAVPRTDVPPPRSVSSRGNSFSGPSGPGSVGSLDDVSTTTTPPVSLSGSVSSTSGLAAAMGSEKLSRTTSASANLMPNGMLGGYAAAVRFGGRALPKTSSSNAMLPSSSVTSPRPLSSNGDVSSINGISLDTSTISGVADALSSLVIGDGGSSRGGGILGGSSAASPPLSASSSSRGSSDHLVDTGTVSSTNGHLSPLDVALHPLDNDPVIEQWKLSPSSGPQLSPSAPLGSPSESSFLPHGLVDDSAEPASNLSWQATPWQQQSWGSPPLPRSQQQQQPPLPPAPAPLFSIFSNQRSRGTPLHGSSAWHSNADPGYGNNDTAANSGGDSFGNGMMGMGLSIDGGFGTNGVGRGAFGMHSEGDNSAPYSSLGGFLQQDYLPSDHEQQHETGAAEHPLDSASFGRMMSSEVPPDADDLRKEPTSMEYDLPSSAAEYHRQYR
ncbi:Nucleotide-binding alpha-beta plait domain [Phytophthora cactorum]|nr:Nucleotide-binding alpha-beta plait domain [Phytophthora cactorum]